MHHCSCTTNIYETFNVIPVFYLKGQVHAGPILFFLYNNDFCSVMQSLYGFFGVCVNLSISANEADHFCSRNNFVEILQ